MSSRCCGIEDKQTDTVLRDVIIFQETSRERHSALTEGVVAGVTKRNLYTEIIKMSYPG